MKSYRTVCPLDCWDRCSIIIKVNENNEASIEGDGEHPITRGFLCNKGRQHLHQLNSLDRIRQPLKKVNGEWIAIQWQQAIKEIGDQLISILNNEGPSSIIHLSDAGHCGLLKNIDKAFFNSLGGITKSIGSLCWGAGIEAQRLDFGRVLSHDPSDHLNSNTIVIWGRNPVYTNIHLMPFLQEAKKKGSNLIVIDPIKTATAALSTHFYQIKPESDGHLAMAMAKLIIDKNWVNEAFLRKYSKGFTEFKHQLEQYSLAHLLQPTGLSERELYELTELYTKTGPSSIILGYGLQRYPNGGNNIRYIDAVAAITGNIGVAGGGVSYANQYINQWIDWQYAYNTPQQEGPSFVKSKFASYVLQDRRNEIKAIFSTRGNPVLQMPDTNKTLEAFNSIPLKVTIDHFMTDTAKNSDYVLPCTHMFEEEDFLFSSMWHSYFSFSEKVFHPQDEVKSEFEIFKALADYMKLQEFSRKYPSEKFYLEKALSPLLRNIGLSLEDLNGKSFKLKGNDIPWENRIFSTASKKFEFIEPQIDTLTKEANKDYPLQLLTLHPKDSLHSQHFRTVDQNLPTVYCNQQMLSNYNIAVGDTVSISSPYGEIKCIIDVDNGAPINIIYIYEGWWLKAQGINNLTSPGYSDIGNQAIYNHCFCKISKI